MKLILTITAMICTGSVYLVRVLLINLQWGQRHPLSIFMSRIIQTGREVHGTDFSLGASSPRKRAELPDISRHLQEIYPHCVLW